MILSDLHTHTVYCDGKNTPEEIILSAINKGFKSIGFSGHSYTDFDDDFCMSYENTKKYISEITILKEKYKDIIDVLLGTERDYFYSPDKYRYDFIIGSQHYIKKDNSIMSVDDTAELSQKYVDEYFDSDYRKYVSLYYETIAGICEKTGADIVGHFDIVTKFNNGNRYFDENAKWYKDASLCALENIAKYRPLIEVNTGGMAGGYRTRPYPDIFILKEIKRLGLDVILASDCHDATKLGYKFDYAAEILKQCGFEYITVMTSGKRKNIRI